MIQYCKAGEGNGTPLQCSCLENPRDGGALWAAIYGVAQSRTLGKDLAAAAAAVLQGNLPHSVLEAGRSPTSTAASGQGEVRLLLRALFHRVKCAT